MKLKKWPSGNQLLSVSSKSPRPVDKRRHLLTSSSTPHSDHDGKRQLALTTPGHMGRPAIFATQDSGYYNEQHTCDESMSSLKFTVWNMRSSQSETGEAVWVWTLRNDVAKNTYHSEECLRPYCSPYTEVNSVSAAVTLLIIASSCPFDASSRWLLGTGLRYSRSAHVFWTLLSLYHIRIVFISTEDDNVRLVPQAPARETHEANLLLRGLKDRPFEQFYGDAFHILSYLCAAWSGISQESTRSIC